MINYNPNADNNSSKLICNKKGTAKQVEIDLGVAVSSKTGKISQGEFTPVSSQSILNINKLSVAHDHTYSKISKKTKRVPDKKKFRK